MASSETPAPSRRTSRRAITDGSSFGRPYRHLTFASEFPESAEITWMAVAPEAHRRGVGRGLVEALVSRLRSCDCEVLLVKTLADTHPSPEYAATRAFYRAMGFLPLTVLPDLWDQANPCLLMVRAISRWS